MAEVDLIIPTIQGREASLARCRESFEATGADLNVIVVPDSKTCGWGWKQGLAASEAPYVALVADDLECISDRWAEVCIETVDLGLLPCPRVYLPDGTIESQGGDMHVLNHIIARHVKDGTQVDYTTVPFMSREQADEIGMIETQYACDTWVSHRGRQLGYDTVLRHGYDLRHHRENVGRGAGMTVLERDAMDTEAMFTELAYGSHTPHLRAILQEVKPRRVLEIGAGRYSTREFLNANAEVESVETDPAWRKQDGITWLDEIPERLDYDLVFVDGPDTEAGRLESIRSVLSREHPITVIHDAEHPPYREEIERWTNGNVEYWGTERQTAIVR